MSYVRHIMRTGNAATDTANIQNAIDYLTTTQLGWDYGTIILTGGQYYINQTLKFGNIGTKSNPYSGADEAPPKMVGATTAVLRWAGGTTTDYMIVYSGVSNFHGVGAYLQNLNLQCVNSCRGIRVHKATYHKSLRDILVRQWRGVGIDLIDCWGSEVRNVAVSGGDGIGMRMQGGGTMLLDHVQITGEATNFPSTSEEEFWNYNGNWVQTAAGERAGLVIRSGQVVGQIITLENYTGNDYPGIYIGASNCHLRGIRWEGCDNNDCRVRIAGSDHVTLEGMTEGQTGVNYLVRATGECQGIQVRSSSARARQGILCLDGGTHSGHRVSDIEFPSAYYHNPRNYIVQRNSPTLPGEPSAHDSSSVSIPWN